MHQRPKTFLRTWRSLWLRNGNADVPLSTQNPLGLSIASLIGLFTTALSLCHLSAKLSRRLSVHQRPLALTKNSL